MSDNTFENENFYSDYSQPDENPENADIDDFNGPEDFGPQSMDHHNPCDSHDHEEKEQKRHRRGRHWAEESEHGGFKGYGHRGQGPRGRHEEGDEPHPDMEPGPHSQGHGPRPNMGPGPHDEPRNFNEEEYASLDTDGKLNVLLHDLSHMSRFGMENRTGQSRILQILAQSGDITQRILTAKLGIQPGSVSELLRKLERSGYITRSANESDRRTTDVHLTDAGREIYEASEQDNPSLFSALTDEEKDQLLILLEKLRADWRERLPKERRDGPGRSMRQGGRGRGDSEGHGPGGRGRSGPGGHGPGSRGRGGFEGHGSGGRGRRM